MDKKLLLKKEKILLGLKAKLDKKLVTLKNIEDLGDSADDNALEASAVSTNLGLKKDVSLELKEVNKALAAIKSGKYGICQDCKSKIEEHRLELVPTALRCSSCQRKIK